MLVKSDYYILFRVSFGKLSHIKLLIYPVYNALVVSYFCYCCWFGNCECYQADGTVEYHISFCYLPRRERDREREE